MDAAEALAGFAEFERRAQDLYRRFATIYAGTLELAAMWQEMSDIEAGHFTTLGQAVEVVRVAPGELRLPPGLAPGSMAATQKILQDAEQKAADDNLPAGDAVQLALMLESSELPRIIDLFGWLPEPAKTSVGSGIVAGLEEHLACLERMAVASGRPDVAEKSRALQAMARGIAQRHAASPHP